jgi:hypothetical protein
MVAAASFPWSSREGMTGYEREKVANELFVYLICSMINRLLNLFSTTVRSRDI